MPRLPVQPNPGARKCVPRHRPNAPARARVPPASRSGGTDRLGHASGGQPPRVQTVRRPLVRRIQEAAISANLQASRAYAEEFIAEDDVLVTARKKAEELGCVPVLPGAGAALRLLAAVIAAKSVVEVGTGAGVGSVWLLRGMRPDGVLTTIDVEPEHHRAARETFAAADVPSNRIRLISGRALDVLPRLTDGGYDLVFCDADKTEYAGYLEQAIRLLRPGGLVVFDNALWHDRVADPAQRDETTIAIRELGKAVRDDERLVGALLHCGDGLLAAVKSAP